jgi:hypothetical protein
VIDKSAEHNPQRFSTIDKTKDLKEDKEKRSNGIRKSNYAKEQGTDNTHDDLKWYFKCEI